MWACTEAAKKERIEIVLTKDGIFVAVLTLFCR